MNLKRILKRIFHKKDLDTFYTRDFFRDKKFIIGEFTYGKPNVIFENKKANLIIGKYCSIASGVTIFLGGNHRVDWITTYPFSVLNKEFPKGRNIIGHPATKGDVIIGNDVWVGKSVTIMSGVRISDGTVLAANSLITKNVGAYEIWGGNPAKLLKDRFNQEEKNKLLELKWWNWNSQKIIDNMKYLCSNNIENLK